MKIFEFAAIGIYFKKKREASNISQKELAKALGYTSPQMISNWERALCAPPIEAIAQMIPLFSLSKKEVMELLLDENKRYLSKKFSASVSHRRAA